MVRVKPCRRAVTQFVNDNLYDGSPSSVLVPSSDARCYYVVASCY